ncbi:hypothetical protein Shyd_84030 [Streptomyces hydrogenans]|uniref:Uncharacterized protein n=1 Tax=Streptomyces hydrogenans TaxID=1873719 RepID=A0ABQ3PPV8_9ACTN|nr:hypothetical protein [Streptomyces hydrogenans]GHI27032.1 hypothetical protein Shyd_84030 [Streptomyces hydrogenans]
MSETADGNGEGAGAPARRRRRDPEWTWAALLDALLQLIAEDRAGAHPEGDRGTGRRLRADGLRALRRP